MPELEMSRLKIPSPFMDIPGISVHSGGSLSIPQIVRSTRVLEDYSFLSKHLVHFYDCRKQVRTSVQYNYAFD